MSPTLEPTQKPTPGRTPRPTVQTVFGSSETDNPTARTASPTSFPTLLPTPKPSVAPTYRPTLAPSTKPSGAPTSSPTSKPTERPTDKPSVSPTKRPTQEPSSSPTEIPTQVPTANSSSKQSPAPSTSPSKSPTGSPTLDPTQPSLPDGIELRPNTTHFQFTPQINTPVETDWGLEHSDIVSLVSEFFNFTDLEDKLETEDFIYEDTGDMQMVETEVSIGEVPFTVDEGPVRPWMSSDENEGLKPVVTDSNAALESAGSRPYKRSIVVGLVCFGILLAGGNL